MLGDPAPSCHLLLEREVCSGNSQLTHAQARTGIHSSGLLSMYGLKVTLSFSFYKRATLISETESQERMAEMCVH